METLVSCPFCGEPTAITVDAEEGAQSFVQDCDVCCQPIQVRASFAPDGDLSVACERE